MKSLVHCAPRMSPAARAALAGLGLIAALPAALPAAAEPVCRAASPARALIDSVAMNTHMQQGWQYDDAARTVATLKDLGITQIRDSFTGLGKPSIEYAAREGMRFNFIIDGGWGDKVVPALEDWLRRYPGSILSIEGPNEVNNWPVKYRGLTGIPAAQAFQKSLYDGVHASPALRNIPVVALTSWPVFENRSDLGNIHAYSRSGGFLGAELKSGIADETTLNPPAKRIWLTEVGYHTHLGEDHDEGVSEAVQAKMVPTLFLTAFGLGIEKSFYYQLANQYTNPDDQQSYFGLVDQQWKPKPAYHALKAMLAILRAADAGPRAAEAGPPGLSYALAGLPETGRHHLFRTGGGDWLLALWNEPELWNRKDNVEIDNPVAQVTLSLAGPHPEVALLDPLQGKTALATWTGTDSVVVGLDDHPVFVRIKAAPAGKPGAACTPDAATR